MSNKQKTWEETARFVYQVAEYRGWVVNPDKEFVDDIIDGLKANYNRYGYYLCPCRDGDGDREADKDIICPCEYNVPDQKEYGHCFCGLFLSQEFADSGEEVRPIPERRESF